jgi:tRNA wybutosine-synthesizing protein 1
MKEPEKYAELIKKAEPDFIEAKGYMFVGGSRQRLSIANMPTHEEILKFAKELNKDIDYNLIGEKNGSRVALLSSGEKDAKIKK